MDKYSNICVFMNTYVWVGFFLCDFLWLVSGIYMYIFICMIVNRMCICIHICTYIYIYICTYIYVYIYVYVYIYIYIYTYIYVYIYKYSYIYI
jgi:hypothetical protein